MLKALVTLSVLCTLGVYGLQHDGLRATYGWSKAKANVDFFYKVPRTLKEAESGGWYLTERPPGPLPELKMYCPPGRVVCSLYNSAGFISGMQISVPTEDFKSSPVVAEKYLVKWHAPATKTEPAKDYMTSTQFYVSEASLKSGGPTVEKGATLQDGGVWVTGSNGQLVRIPVSEGELSKTAYKKQNCIDNMGTHYYHNMTRELSCDDLFPWFVLVIDGKVIGTGFYLVGEIVHENPEHRKWFDTFTDVNQSVQAVIPFAPKCLPDSVAKFGWTSIHVYYTDAPWEIKCRPGDSAQPAN